MPDTNIAADLQADLWNARYRDDWATGEAPWNDVLASLLSHRSVRAFLPTPLPKGSLEMAVAAA